MYEDFQQNLLTHSYLNQPLAQNTSSSFNAIGVASNQASFSQPYKHHNQNLTDIQHSDASLSQSKYQSLDYGQKITVSHNILKGLVSMLDRKFPKNESYNDPVQRKKPEISCKIDRPRQLLQKKSGSEQKMQEKMVEVRDRLASIIKFINREIEGKGSKNEEKLVYLQQVNQYLSQNSDLQQTRSQNNKDVYDIKGQQKPKQQKTQNQTRIIIDKDKLNNAKQVFSQQMLSTFPHHQSSSKRQPMKSSLDRISQAHSGQTVGINSNKISELNPNMSQVKSEQQKVYISFNQQQYVHNQSNQQQNAGQLDQTGRIILSTINKKTVSTTTIPKNASKSQKESWNHHLDKVAQKKETEIGPYSVKKSKFWKDKATVFVDHKTNYINKVENKLKQIENTNDLKESQTWKQEHQNNLSYKPIQPNSLIKNQLYHPLTPNNPQKMLYRNNSLKEFQRKEFKQPFETQLYPRIKPNLQQTSINSPQMNESKIIQQFRHLNHNNSKPQEAIRVSLQHSQAINPEMSPKYLQPRSILSQNQSPANQKRQQVRINLVPQPSNRSQSLPSHFNNNFNQRNQLMNGFLGSNHSQNLALSPQKTIIKSFSSVLPSNISRNYHPVSNNIPTGLPKSPFAKEKSPIISRPGHMLLQNIDSFHSVSTVNSQQKFLRPSININQIYRENDTQKTTNNPNKRASFSVNHIQLQKIIELSEQSMQNSIRKDNRSDYSMQTNKLYLSTANHSNSSNGRPLKKRGIQLTSKEFINVQQIQ